MTHKEALTLALEYMNEYYPSYAKQAAHHHKVSTAIKESLAQPEQKPVKYKVSIGCRACGHLESFDMEVNGLTTPPQRKPLTDDEIDAIWFEDLTLDHIERLHRVLAAHGIKEKP